MDGSPLKGASDHRGGLDIDAMREERKRGVFRKGILYVLVDESGDSNPPDGRFFTMSATITDDPRKLWDIAENARRELDDGDELKFKDNRAHPNRMILRQIAETNPVVYAVVAAKEDIHSNAVESHREAARQLFEKVLESFAGENVIFRVDENNKLKEGKLKKIVKEESAIHGANVLDIDITRSVENDDMQAQDMVAGAVGKKYNGPGETAEFINLIPEVKIWRIKI